MIFEDDTPERSTWLGTAAGAALFLVMGLVMTLMFLPEQMKRPIFDHLWLLFWAPFLLLPPIGFAIGWIARFPRWSFPYLVLAVLTAVYMTNVATPGLRIFGHTFGHDDLWGPRAFIPLLLAVAAALAVTRSLRPWETFGRRLLSDWTVGSFALMGLLPMFSTVCFDETREYAVPWLIVLSLVECVTAATYLHASQHRTRATTLLIGCSVTVLAALIGGAYFDWSRHGTPPNVIALAICAAVVLGVIFLPAGVAWAASRLHFPPTTVP